MENIKVNDVKKDFRSFRYLVAGIVAGATVLAADSFTGPKVNSTEFFEEEGLPKVMRLYRSLSNDQLMVENPENPGEYIRFKDYLSTFEDKHDRDVRKAELERLVNW